MSPEAPDIDEARWRELADAVRRYVRRRVRQPDEAEDVTQDVFVKLADHLRRGTVRGPLHAWLFRAARTTVIDHLRARTATTVPAADLAADEPPPDAAAADAPLLASFRAFVHGLPAEQRDALLRTEFDGWSQKQLAERLGVAVSTVKSRVQRGRRRLARELLDCCTFEFDRRGQLLDWQRRPGGGCREC
ncbi:MAG: sigma-70 family RNA polymerase sigma factor [Planctomycetes bacterium]|nr:sigma-70 family RNA polymerase sigma factor [Planctomycetota bacterium]